MWAAWCTGRDSGERGTGVLAGKVVEKNGASPLHRYEKLMKNETQTHHFSTNFFIEKIIFFILKIIIEFFYI